MSNGWHNHEPAPIEFLHGKLQDLFRYGACRSGGIESTKDEFTTNAHKNHKSSIIALLPPFWQTLVMRCLICLNVKNTK